MKQISVFLLAGLLGLVFIGSANAGYLDNYVSLKASYASASAGYLGDSIDGFGGYLALGQQRKQLSWLNLRNDFEIQYYNQSHGDIGLSTYAAALNFYADFGTENWIVLPYIGTGFGAALANINAPFEMMAHDSAGGFLFVLQGGAIFNISDRWKIDAGLRRDSIYGVEYTIRNFGGFVGFRYHFGYSI